MGKPLRPLLSKDGLRVTSFSADGTLVIRNVDDCLNPVPTHVAAAKADFSWDGRYVAYHTLKPDHSGYAIEVIDLLARTVIAVTDLQGSSLFPNWTTDGRLYFRYDSDSYHGFVAADHFLANPSWPLPSSRPAAPNAGLGATWA